MSNNEKPPIPDRAGMDAIDRLTSHLEEHRQRDPQVSRTARLFRMGRARLAEKVGEEAIEIAIEAVRGDRTAVLQESADLVYNLAALWVDLGIRPEEVWAEMARREARYGIAEKLRKDDR